MVKNSSFFVVQGWMINELGLAGIELLIYAIIYGFSQDGKSVFSGTASYLADWTGSTKQTVFGALKKLCAKGYIERIEKQVNGVKLVDYKILQGVKNFDGGSQKILLGGSQKILPHNINIDNINNTTKSLFSDEVEKPAKKEKAKNPLQIFSNEVIKNFEPDIHSDGQKAVWFRRNCRNLRDILAFCEGNIPLALRTIDVCIRWLDERKLTGGYEAVLRHIPEFYATAKKELEVENEKIQIVGK